MFFKLNLDDRHIQNETLALDEITRIINCRKYQDNPSLYYRICGNFHFPLSINLPNYVVICEISFLNAGLYA